MANKSVLEGVAAITAFIAVIIGIAAIWLLLAFPLMWAWNYAIPHIFNLKPITWGQAWCLAFVVNILFTGHVKTSK